MFIAIWFHTCLCEPCKPLCLRFTLIRLPWLFFHMLFMRLFPPKTLNRDTKLKHKESSLSICTVFCTNFASFLARDRETLCILVHVYQLNSYCNYRDVMRSRNSR